VAGAPGATITVEGSGYRMGIRAYLDTVEIKTLTVLENAVTFTAPQIPPGPKTLTMMNVDGTSARGENAFTVLGTGPPSPHIDGVAWGLAPLSGLTPFLVYGEGFRLGATVLVGGVVATDVDVIHGGFISATAPAALGPAGTRTVSVTNPSGTYDVKPEAFSYVDLDADRCLVFGRILTQMRQALPLGLSGALGQVACPWIRVEILAGSTVSAVTYADGWGFYVVEADADQPIHVRTCSAAKVPPSITENIFVLTDDASKAVYGVETLPFSPPAGGAVHVSLLVPEIEPVRPAGAFHIVRVAAKAADFVQTATGEALPAIELFWYSGNASAQLTSYFIIAPDGTPSIYILGGVKDFISMSDTDEYDVAVLTHEFGHFVQYSLGVDASPGGRHGGEMLVPNLAFSEGFANWFCCAGADREEYRDTLGVGDRGYMRLAFRPERIWWRVPVVCGIGSEESVTEILWDMTDGVYPRPDRDNDGVCIGPDRVLAAVQGFDPDWDFTSIQTLFRELTQQGSLGVSTLQGLLLLPQPQAMTYPPAQDQVFPRVLEDRADDFIDAMSAYRPAAPDWRFWLAASEGNPPNPRCGFNSRRYFAFSVATPKQVTLRLEIEGSGKEPEDLDLYLLDTTHEVQVSSRGYGPVEEIHVTCFPGRVYVAEVRGFKDFGLGVTSLSSARFSLFLTKE
jgi:hypothetical protein